MKNYVNPLTHRKVNLKNDNSVVSEKDRLLTLKRMSVALKRLQETIDDQDLPPKDIYQCDSRYLEHVRRLSISNNTIEGFYDLNILEGYLAFGEPMLNGLTKLTKDELTRFIEVLVLHEVVHIDQKMYSSTHHGISHASVVLEEMDFLATAVSQSIAIRWCWRTNPNGQSLTQIAKNYTYMTLRGTDVFDKTAHPKGMKNIAESRLRRYLISGIQCIRASAIVNPDDIARYLIPRLAVELEPVVAELDDNFERVIVNVTSDTELFFSLGGTLGRQVSVPGFNAEQLFKNILQFEWEAVEEQLRYVTMQYKETLLPTI